MRILIEFVDAVAVNNIAATMILRPDKVYFLGKDDVAESARLRNWCRDFQNICRKHDLEIDMEYWPISENSVEMALAEMNALLSELNLDRNPKAPGLHPDAESEIYIDIRGGREVPIFVAGQVFGSLNRNDIKLVQPNGVTGDIYIMNVGQVGGRGWERYAVSSVEMPFQISVKEYVALYGGNLFDTGIVLEREDKELNAGIESLWKVCKEDPERWNRNLVAAVRTSSNPSETEKENIDILLGQLKEYKLLLPVRKGNKSENKSEIYSQKEQILLDRYKLMFAPAMREILNDVFILPGRALEYYVALTVWRILRKYKKVNQVVTGAKIDLDGKMQPDGKALGAFNEVDVMCMAGVRPVFISCKSGDISGESYKLSNVSQRLSGDHGISVLVSGKSLGISEVLWDRFEKDHIIAVDDVFHLQNEDFLSRIEDILVGV